MSDFDKRVQRLKKLEELSRNNPVVHAALMYHKRGDLTFEQALIECVLVLASINKDQFDLIIKHEMERTTPRELP